MDCLFCRIIEGSVPSTKVYEDENVYAFRDINPQAPVHVLVLPRKHMANILECDGETMCALLSAVQKIARQEGIDETGFRIVSNCGRDGAQSVEHLHIHLMGGAQLSGTMA
ncbi:MAG: histidine triad nucleotide-binding protein [Clostridia bacterium]|nr:histidine triad nucleotide-binding protein [Clostridia bacterium]